MYLVMGFVRCSATKEKWSWNGRSHFVNLERQSTLPLQWRHWGKQPIGHAELLSVYPALQSSVPTWDASKKNMTTHHDCTALALQFSVRAKKVFRLSIFYQHYRINNNIFEYIKWLAFRICSFAQTWWPPCPFCQLPPGCQSLELSEGEAKSSPFWALARCLSSFLAACPFFFYRVVGGFETLTAMENVESDPKTDRPKVILQKEISRQNKQKNNYLVSCVSLNLTIWEIIYQHSETNPNYYYFFALFPGGNKNWVNHCFCWSIWRSRCSGNDGIMHAAEMEKMSEKIVF